MVALSKLVIAGGGIVGNSIAYFIAKSKSDVSITLVDPVGIAPGASSKAGGFLAKQWRDGTPLQSMQRLGFELHQELANDLGCDRVGYRRISCHSVSVGNVDKLKENVQNVVKWADKNNMGSTLMGDEDVIAQVHPGKLCEAMWEKTSALADAELRKGRIVKALTKKSVDTKSSTCFITGVELEDGTIIEADALVVACGAWTNDARSWFPSGTQIIPEITGVKCHSMLVKPKNNEVFDQAVFFESYENSALDEADVEVYPRPDGDCYVNGFQGDEGIVEERPGQEMVNTRDIDCLKQVMRETSSHLGNVEPHTTQACYWPETPDGLPCVGPLHGIEGAFVATGHSVWGILQGPITGKAIAELLLNKKSDTLNLSCFDIQRFQD